MSGIVMSEIVMSGIVMFEIVNRVGDYFSVSLPDWFGSGY